MTTEIHQRRKAMRALSYALLVVTLALCAGEMDASAQAQDPLPPASYVVGAQDVLTINCYDQNDLSGKFTLETDGTFTYPLIGRVTAGGLTLREVEAELKRRLVTEGYFKKPQITV